jgi:hypothetical protein
MAYYYACSYPLAPGSVVLKGNWGRICQLEPLSSRTLLKEVILEQVREQEYPDRPSRFESTFLCPNLESIHNFIRSTSRHYDLLYEVDLVDPDAVKFETDWSLLPPDNATITEAEDAARKYWRPQAPKDDAKEILVLSDIKIVRRLDRY